MKNFEFGLLVILLSANIYAQPTIPIDMVYVEDGNFTFRAVHFEQP